MKKSHIPVPRPASSFLRVKCDECGEIQVVYSHASTPVACNACGNEIATPTGSGAKLRGTVQGAGEEAAQPARAAAAPDASSS